MQYSVPYRVEKKRGKARVVVAAVLCVTIIFVMMFVFLAKSKKTELFRERSFYLVYVYKSKDIESLYTGAEIIKFMGGAGIIYDYKGVQYVLTSLYFDYAEATQVLERLKKNFAEAGIIDVYTKVVGSRIRQQVNSEHILREYYEKLQHFMEELFEMGMSYASGKLPETELCRNLMAWKMKIMNIRDELRELAKDSQIAEKTYISSVEVVKLLDEFFQNFYGSRIKKALVYKLSTEISLKFADTVNNL